MKGEKINQTRRTIMFLEYLKKNTDPDHKINLKDVREYFEGKNINLGSRNTVHTFLVNLADAMNLDENYFQLPDDDWRIVFDDYKAVYGEAGETEEFEKDYLQVSNLYYNPEFSHEDISSMVEAINFSRTMEPERAEKLKKILEEKFASKHYKTSASNVCKIYETPKYDIQQLRDNLRTIQQAIDENVEIKKDFIVPAGNKSALVKWVVAQNGRINIDLEYTKLKNEDANPSWPDGVTVYLFHNSKVLKQLSFQPYTDREVTGSLSVNALSVKAGDVITMLVDPGKNPAYDAGKYMFVIEDTDKIPAVAAGNWDNNTSLKGLGSVKQGTDGWFFLEGRSISDVRVLTKATADGLGWLSRRTDGLEMKDGYVHTGESWDPIYQWVAGQSGRIDISGEYMKFGHQDPNPNWPDGVVVKIWHNGTLLKNTKVQVRKGDGNNNTISFSFDGLAVARGDKLSFQISAGANNAWDGGQISVVIEAASNVKRTPGDDNNTNLGALASLKQGEDGWWFLEGTTLANAKLLTAMNALKDLLGNEQMQSLLDSMKKSGMEVSINDLEQTVKEIEETDEADLPIIEEVYASEQKNYQQPLVVEKVPLKNFYTAEEYHQDYLDKNPDGYCHLPQSLFEFARQARCSRRS